MHLFTIGSLAALVGTLGCAPEPSPKRDQEAHNEARTTATTLPSVSTRHELSLRQRIDGITVWPEVDRSRLLPLLSNSTTFQAIGSPDISLQGTKEILDALKTLQSAENPWRVATTRGTETSSRIVIELELVRCKDPSSGECKDRRAALIFARIDDQVIREAVLYLSESWQANTKNAEAQRPVRWVGGRRNPNLEKAFLKVWTGDLDTLLDDNFVFVDKATGQRLRGKTAFITHRARYARFISDAQCSSQEMHSAGDVVMALSTCEGVFARNLVGKGRKIKVRLADVARFEGSKLVELHTYSNHEEATTQLGVPEKPRSSP